LCGIIGRSRNELPFYLVAVFAVMLYTSWQLTLVCITVVPFLILASYIFKEKVKASYQRVRTQISKMNAFLQERITGMRIVQIFNAEADEMQKFKEINQAYTAANLNAILYYAVFFFNLLDMDQVIEDKGAHKIEKLNGRIEFKEVSFAYLAKDYVLKDLSFTIEAGQTLAIVGSTGSGKSTIINILSRFYETQKGTIEIDGVNIRDYELQALRNRLAVVLQDVFLFTGTVYDNITLRDDRITQAQVLEAAKLIGAHEFIEKLPGGYQYDVMERGATLSDFLRFVTRIIFSFWIKVVFLNMVHTILYSK